MNNNNEDDNSEEANKIRELIKSKSKNLWRFKLALIHRVNQKEILHN